MSHIEIKKTKSNNYAFFVKKVSFMGAVHVIKKNIGLQSAVITKEKFLIDNLDSISQEEFNFRKKYLGEIISKISYQDKLAEKIEFSAIELDNLIDAKKCQEIADIEFAKEFIFNSNNIEGSKIPSNIVREIIDKGDTRYANKNEVREVKNSINAFGYLKKEFKFNIPSIKRLYHILTKGLEMEGGIPYPRGFKKVQNVVGNSTTTSPENVEEELKKLLEWYQKNKNKIHPLILAFDFHKRYEKIHPFLDGNGRTGRLIMNKILMNGRYPPIIVYKENKESYFNSLTKANEGMPKKYYHFMLEQTEKTYDFLKEVVKKY